MPDIYPIHLLTRGEVRADGWSAESRDAGGRLCSAHAKFDDDKSLVQYVRKRLENSETVTIWPHEIAAKSDYPSWGE